LEGKSLESNAYLSPHFAIPAIQYLEAPIKLKNMMLIVVEKTTSTVSNLVGLGIFILSRGTRQFPLPHLQAYRSIHSYLSGILVDRDEPQAVMEAFFRFFCEKNAPWHGVQFEYLSSEGLQAELMMATAREYGATWHGHWNFHRAVFFPQEGGEQYVHSRFPAHRIKEFRRLWRRLEEQGKVGWKVSFGNGGTADDVDRFLVLEHNGWKGKEGTSLRSQPIHEAFFKEMVRGFRKDKRLFITELSLDGLAIASSVNLISGGAGFAFKIGWHADFAKMSPGVLNEVEFIRHAPEIVGGLKYIDSGAVEGSFIDNLWVGRRVLTSGIFGTTSVGKRALNTVAGLRNMKKILSTGCKKIQRSSAFQRLLCRGF
jgi:hypothetical protein